MRWNSGPEAHSRAAQTPIEVRIASVRAGGEAYRGTPRFVQDNLDKLDQERRAVKQPNYVVAIFESETLSAYDHFCWTISLHPDFENDFALSARGAYLVHATPRLSFTDLPVHGAGNPFIDLRINNAMI